MKQHRITLTKVATVIIGVAVFAVMCIPYSTQVSPAVNVQVVDTNGKGIAHLPAMWDCGFYAASFSGTCETDSEGFIRLPARTVRLSEWSRVGKALSCLRPHSGFREPASAVEIQVPRGQTFYTDRLNGPTLTRDSGADRGFGRVRAWQLPGDRWMLVFSEGRTGMFDEVAIVTGDPTIGGAGEFRVTIGPKPSATMPNADVK